MNPILLPVKNPFGTLLTVSDQKKLIKAGYKNTKPIVKLFVGPLTWLVTGMENDILYGYADLSMGCVEFGSLIHINELNTIKQGPFYLEKDRWFNHKDGAKYLEMSSLCGI